jgi:hypothetical protein
MIRTIEDFAETRPEHESWDQVRRAWREYRRGYVFGVPLFRISRALQGSDGHGHDYRDDLAAYPGDPAACIDGPRALRRLIDRRKREGWVRGESYADIAASLKHTDPEPIDEKLILEDVREARAIVARGEDLKDREADAEYHKKVDDIFRDMGSDNAE